MKISTDIDYCLQIVQEDIIISRNPNLPPKWWGPHCRGCAAASASPHPPRCTSSACTGSSPSAPPGSQTRLCHHLSCLRLFWNEVWINHSGGRPFCRVQSCVSPKTQIFLQWSMICEAFLYLVTKAYILNYMEWYNETLSLRMTRLLQCVRDWNSKSQCTASDKGRRITWHQVYVSVVSSLLLLKKLNFQIFNGLNELKVNSFIKVLKF